MSQLRMENVIERSICNLVFQVIAVDFNIFVNLVVAFLAMASFHLLMSISQPPKFLIMESR